MHDSGNDPEWLAIAQQVPDGKQMQAGADDEAAQACCSMPPCELHNFCSIVQTATLHTACDTLSGPLLIYARHTVYPTLMCVAHQSALVAANLRSH